MLKKSWFFVMKRMPFSRNVVNRIHDLEILMKINVFYEHLPK